MNLADKLSRQESAPIQQEKQRRGIQHHLNLILSSAETGFCYRLNAFPVAQHCQSSQEIKAEKAMQVIY